MSIDTLPNLAKDLGKLGMIKKICQLKLPNTPMYVNWPNAAVVDWFETVLDTGGMHPSYAVTFIDAGDTVNRTAHGWANGTKVSFTSITSTTGIVINTIYYIVNSAANTFQLSATLGGAALPLTTNGSGTIIINPSRITMPSDGWARFTATAWFGRGTGWVGTQAIVNGMVLGATLLKNGYSSFYGHMDNEVQLLELSYTDQIVPLSTGLLQVSAGDYFEIMFNNSSGFGSTYIDLSPSGFSNFQCEFTSENL